MEDLTKRLLEKLKQVLGIDSDEKDLVLEFAVETAVMDVLNYCNLDIEEFPPMLDNTTVLIAQDLLREGGYLLSDEERQDGTIKSLSEGDFSIIRETEMEIMQKMISAPSFSRNYFRNLNRFRRLAR